ncbi:thioesterase family protein [Pseudokineococcus sp. 5B2Z-1]|uniref:thioesterase family protein n=1 Tax=Pseudokineococcus sp. 5B2Z-1 TaxID=3132744 RepID=UPI0030B0D75B
MSGPRHPPETPLVHAEDVRPEWLDYNGHLSEAYYVLVMGHATDALMDATGLDADYRAATGCSLYTVEAHVRYLHEVRGDARLTVRTRVVGLDDKRVHLVHEMHAAVAGRPGGDGPVATEEVLALHVDGAAGRAAPLPAERRAALGRHLAPAPAHAHRAIREVGAPVA